MDDSAEPKTRKRSQRTASGWRSIMARFEASGLAGEAFCAGGAYGSALAVFDAFVRTVFVLEIAAKLYGRGWAFFRDPWNVFDFLVVAIALVPTSGPFSVLRALRILRVMRLVSVVPQMRRVTQALVLAIPGMAPIIGLIGIIFYVAAVIASSFFGTAFDTWFGSVGESMYTLFQSFAVINLFIGVIVDAMQTQHEQEVAEVEEHVHADATTLRDEIALLRGEVAALHEALGASSGDAPPAGAAN